MLYQTLHYMCEGVDPEVLSLIYQTKMLPVLGMRPYFDTCAICHQETDLSPSLLGGRFSVLTSC